MANFVNNNSQKLKKGLVTLGIDQSFTHTGIVIDYMGETVHAEGICTKPINFLEVRINDIVDKVSRIIKKYDIEQIAIEGISFGSKFSSARQLAGLFYGLVCMFDKTGLPYTIIPPNSLKKRATGDGKADKEKMVESIPLCDKLDLSEKTNLQFKSKKFEDIADAYWLSKIAYL